MIIRFDSKGQPKLSAKLGTHFVFGSGSNRQLQPLVKLEKVLIIGSDRKGQVGAFNNGHLCEARQTSDHWIGQ